MSTYRKFVAQTNAPTPQSQPLPNQVENSAGGYSFPVDDWVRLDRFLVLGSESSTYYASEQSLTKENAEAVIRCIETDGLRVVRRIVEISEAGRAPKNEPAIFALALCMAKGSPATRVLAGNAIPKVCRTGTHILHFAEYVNGLRGWGRGLREAVAGWYNHQSTSDLAYQVVKYQQRDGWTHRDLLRLCHALPYNVARYDSSIESSRIVFNWIAKGWPSVGAEPHPDKAASFIWAFEKAKTADKKELVKLITDYRLPREAIPTEYLKDADVWEALLPGTGLTALIRNLGNLSKIGLLSLSRPDIIKTVTARLTNADELAKARIHPIAVLSALITYSQGHGARGHGEWTNVRQVIDALDTAFYLSFGNLVPSGARIMLALDVSGSMQSGEIAGVPGLTPAIASAAMAMSIARTEQDWSVMAFHQGIIPLNISPRQRLDNVLKTTAINNGGGTDCSLPMRYAQMNRIPVDCFVVLTDSETWAGPIHPTMALRSYRQAMGIAAKEVVVGMVSNGFSIADPSDAGQIDIVGFDTATPQLISDFAKPVDKVDTAR